MALTNDEVTPLYVAVSTAAAVTGAADAAVADAAAPTGTVATAVDCRRCLS